MFSATDRGDETAGHTYLQLLSRLFRHIEKEPEGERRQMLEEMFAGIAHEVAADEAGCAGNGCERRGRAGRPC